MKHKIMEVMRERETSRQLPGRVEIYDAYIAGEHADAGRVRGSEKLHFVAAVQTTEADQSVLICVSRGR